MGILRKAAKKLDEVAEKRIETVVEKAIGPKPTKSETKGEKR